ncbi:hypothetical protein, partial [Paraburkholderia ferrariae]
MAFAGASAGASLLAASRAAAAADSVFPTPAAFGGKIPWVTGGTEQTAHPTSDLQSPGSGVMVPCDYTGTQYDSCT